MSARARTPVRLPGISPALAARLESFRPGGFAPPAHIVAEAQAILPAYGHALRPLPEPELACMVEEFAEMLNAGVVNPLPGVALQLRCVALVAACAGVPALAWSGATVRRALVAFTFFPSAAQLVALLEEQCGMARATHSRLRLLVEEAQQRAAREQAQALRWAQWEQRHAARPVYNPVDNVDCMKNPL
ncbi:hypothetical protein [Acetobacter sp. LMG 32666]|uniref:hypothetical protein n=1 Tax=Acetobacter sp. LMG 32666 TaxID=2959295 RepID=UPI0030C86498